MEIVHEPWLDHTGLTRILHSHLDVTRMVDSGIYIFGPGMLLPGLHLDWEKLWKYRVLVKRMGASKWPGRSWERVERHYLYKINIEATIAHWQRAVRSGDDPTFYHPPYEHERTK